MGLLLTGWALLLPIDGPGARNARYRLSRRGHAATAPFGASSFENAQDVIALEDGSIVFCGVVGTVGNFEVAVLKLDPEGNLDPRLARTALTSSKTTSPRTRRTAWLRCQTAASSWAAPWALADRITRHGLVPAPGRNARPRLSGREGRFQYTFDDGEEYIRRVLVTDTHITMVATVKVPGFSYDRIGLVQCTHDGVLDQGFGQDGAIIHTIDDTTDLSVRDGERMSNGGIAVCGYHYNMTDNTEYPFIGLFDAAGQPQAGFGNGGIIIADNQPGEYFAMATAGDILYFAGRTNGDVRDFMIDALHTDGTTYTPFAVYGHFELDNALTDLILDLVIDEEGRLLASGTSGIPGFFGDRDFALLRLLPDGTPDPLFGTDGLTTTTFGEAFDDANALVITPENKAVLVGMSAQTNNDFAIARYILGPVIDGVEESVAQFSVYPNPTDNVLHMAHSEHLTEWSIRTPLGQTIEAGALDQSGQMTLGLSHIPSGAYILTLETPHGPQTQRIFVQH